MRARLSAVAQQMSTKQALTSCFGLVGGENDGGGFGGSVSVDVPSAAAPLSLSSARSRSPKADFCARTRVLTRLVIHTDHTNRRWNSPRAILCCCLRLGVGGRACTLFSESWRSLRALARLVCVCWLCSRFFGYTRLRGLLVRVCACVCVLSRLV